MLSQFETLNESSKAVVKYGSQLDEVDLVDMKSSIKAQRELS